MGEMNKVLVPHLCGTNYNFFCTIVRNLAADQNTFCHSQCGQFAFYCGLKYGRVTRSVRSIKNHKTHFTVT